MKPSDKSFLSNTQPAALKYRQSGNAMIYVLIVIALFAALSFILSRGTDTSEQGILSDEEVTVYAAQIINISNQMKQGLDTLIWSGTEIDDLDFTLPGEAGFSTAPHRDKAHHPEGGGIVMPRIPEGAVDEISVVKPPGWYLGRFNNVEWTPTVADDVIVAANQIGQPVCAKINEMLTASTAIPVITINTEQFFIPTGFNIDFGTAQCAACENYSSLCVSSSLGNYYIFYSIVAQQ